MDTGQTNPLQTQARPSAPTATTGTEAGGSGGMISSDFETFLDMMTTQMENQDPLNPMKSAEFATQLATFSGVEQQVRTNELLTDLVGEGASGALGRYAGWIGMEARSSAPVAFDGTPVTVVPYMPPGAERAELVVRDSDGEEVAREDVDTDRESLTWFGAGADGNPAAEGDYTFHVESFAGGESLGSRPAETYARVAEARAEESGAVLVLDTGCKIAAADVTALREPAQE